MELREAIARRRMTRAFDPAPLGHGLVDDLVDAALRAPTAGNTRGVEALVLTDPAARDRFWECATDPEWRGRSARFPGLSAAPAVVALWCSPEAYDARYREPDKGGGTAGWPVPYWFGDAAFAAMALLLAAEDAGLGAAFLGNFRHEEAVRSAFGVPGGRRWFGTVLLGRPAPGDRRSASLDRAGPSRADRIHRGRW